MWVFGPRERAHRLAPPEVGFAVRRPGAAAQGKAQVSTRVDECTQSANKCQHSVSTVSSVNTVSASVDKVSTKCQQSVNKVSNKVST